MGLDTQLPLILRLTGATLPLSSNVTENLVLRRAREGSDVSVWSFRVHGRCWHVALHVASPLETIFRRSSLCGESTGALTG